MTSAIEFGLPLLYACTCETSIRGAGSAASVVLNLKTSIFRVYLLKFFKLFSALLQIYWWDLYTSSYHVFCYCHDTTSDICNRFIKVWTFQSWKMNNRYWLQFGWTLCCDHFNLSRWIVKRNLKFHFLKCNVLKKIL